MHGQQSIKFIYTCRVGLDAGQTETEGFATSQTWWLRFVPLESQTIINALSCVNRSTVAAASHSRVSGTSR